MLHDLFISHCTKWIFGVLLHIIWFLGVYGKDWVHPINTKNEIDWECHTLVLDLKKLS